MGRGQWLNQGKRKGLYDKKEQDNNYVPDTFQVSTHLILNTFYYCALFVDGETETQRLYEQPLNTPVCGYVSV